MDRLSWYQPGESMEEILCQAGHVGIYDGELKQSAFEQGTISLTLQRIIWADSSDPDCRLILHHSLVDRLDRQHKTMFGRGGKIIVSVRPVPPGHPQGPVAASGFKSLRFIFRNGGEDDFYKRYVDALNRQTWKRTSSSSSSAGSSSRNLLAHGAGSTTSAPAIGSAGAGGATGPTRNVGILGIEKRLAEQHQRTHDSINQAFEDMSKLMEQAKSMVQLSKNITERLRMKGGSEITDDEAENPSFVSFESRPTFTLQTIRLKSYLLGLGVSDPVTKSAFGAGAVYFERLADELTAVLLQPITDCGGTMTLTEAFCRVNRARGVELISPEDLLNACQKFDRVNSPLCLYTFADSGVTVVQLRSLSADAMAEEVFQLVESAGSMDAARLAQSLGISLVLAAERLRAAENQSKLCRDDTLEGLVFYPNRLLDTTADANFSTSS